MAHKNYRKFSNTMLSFVLSLVFFIVGSLAFKAQASGISYNSMGYGPLEGESGMPVATQRLGLHHFAVLDMLKSSVIICDQNGSYVRSFTLPETLLLQNKSFTFRTSPDEFIFIQIQDQLFVYNILGSMIHHMALSRFSDYQPNISLLLPLSQSLVLFFNPFTQSFAYHHLLDPANPLPFSFDASNYQFIDFYALSDQILILGMTYNVSNIKVPSLVYLSLQGDFKFQIELPYTLIPNPIRISATANSQIILLGDQYHYAFLDLQGMPLSSGQLNIDEAFYASFNFTGFQPFTFLIPHTKKGILHFSHSDLKTIFLPVKSHGQQMLAVSSVAANSSFIAAFDSMSGRFVIFQKDQILRSFFISDLPVILDHTSQIQLFASRQWLYVVSVGIELNLLKYDPVNGKISSIKIPEYIPPRSCLYVRPEDDMIYIYSWFDGILYSFIEQSPEISKVVVKRHEAVAHAQHSICKVDASGNIFILLPLLRKMNVYAKDGSLLFSFNSNQNSLSLSSDFHFMEDYLIILNQSDGIVEILSKRGEWIQSLGKKDSIGYPQKKEGYSDKTGSFSFPSAIFCHQFDLYVADTGNSRIQIISMPRSTEKTVIELQVGSPSAYINGRRIELDAPPFISSGRTLVPLRFIGEAFGAKVEWFAAEQKAIIHLEGNKIEVIIGSPKALVNGKEHLLDVPAIISSGRTFVPLRFIGEAFGASIVWEAESKRIIVTYPGH